MKARQIAILGGGLIGRSWSYMFAQSGHRVRICDEASESIVSARNWLAGELSSEDTARVQFCSSLEDAVSGADYVQECVSELIDVKRAIFREAVSLAPASCIFASSTSALLPDAIFSDIAHSDRCLVAHPANPPHVLPIVELVPGRSTSERTMDEVEELMLSLGQDVVRLKRASPGFVLNRLQAALVEEALSLVEAGIADPDDIDRTVRSGLGMRWAFVGPFETMDLNSKGGFEMYTRTLGPALAASAPGGPETSKWNGGAPARVATARRQLLKVSDIPARQSWLIQKLKLLRALKNGVETAGEEQHER
ncbi:MULTISPECIES: 3-hydroxyacyl-CoA dehydrogenase NAD-binding domain-containing protein [Mesorhizobium]|nr:MULTISPECIES: 3-hydroxyacyl-CoA dehydrogenase NAD-binding domain-containing protein [Mesorhizobium]